MQPTPTRRLHRTIAMALTVAVFATACERADDGNATSVTAVSGSTSTIAATSSTTAPSTTTAPPPTTAPSTAPPTSATTPEPPPTVAAPTTTAPPATTAPATTAPPPPTSTPTTTVAPSTTAAPSTTTTLPNVTHAADPITTMWIAGVEEGDPEVTSDGVNCLGFYEAMGATSYSACGEWNAVGGTRVWTVTKGATDRFFAVVWQETAPFNWVPRLRLLEPAAGTWESVTLKAADIDGGPNEELIAGIRYTGTGGYLDIDVIDAIAGNPSVVANVEGAPKGVAFTEDNLGVWIYGAVLDPDEPVCCPTRFSQFLLSSGDAGWTLNEGAPGVPVDMIPFASEF